MRELGNWALRRLRPSPLLAGPARLTGHVLSRRVVPGRALERPGATPAGGTRAAAVDRRVSPSTSESMSQTAGRSPDGEGAAVVTLAGRIRDARA